MELFKERCLGLSDNGLVKLSEESPLMCLPQVKEAFLELKDDASKQGFNLQACSAFRSFEAQARIVSAKFRGERKILDIHEQPLQAIPDDAVERLKAILLFSAMPGFSRHHIGADLDVYAQDRLPEGQSLQLTYHEYLSDSYFSEFGVYLNESIEKFGFSNPYMPKLQLDDASSSSDKVKVLSTCITYEASNVAKRIENGQIAVGPEPWHISHAQTADKYLVHYDVEAAIAYVENADLPFSRYVREVMTQERINTMLKINVLS